MLTFTHGDLFKSKAQTLVATVNCVGIMGKGIAKEFRQRFPDMYKAYFKACKRGELQSGRLFYYKDLVSSILCFPTKDNWKGSSKYEFIEAGLKAIVENYQKWGIDSLALPPLGCGLGGLDWSKVKPLIVKHLAELPIDIEVYEPLKNAERIPRSSPFKSGQSLKLTPALVFTGEMIRIAKENFPKDMPVGRLLLQKIAFFAQMAGLPIQLKFMQYKFGPYDRGLNFNVDRLEGLFVRDSSPSHAKSDLIMLNQEEWKHAIEGASLDLRDARKQIEHAIHFLKKFSLNHIELLSTVLFAWSSLVASGEAGTEEEVLKYVKQWKPGKFPVLNMKQALEQLISSEWVDVSPLDCDKAEVKSDPILL